MASPEQQLMGMNRQSSRLGGCSFWSTAGQGAGATFFTVYIDDIDEVVRFIEFLQKFADDTKLGNTVTSPEDRGRLQLALTNFCDLVLIWGMSKNAK